MMSGISIFL